ncbi:tripartite-type tricarboxylate transporter receptor subunit TctC [Pseudacidovorax sp. 1753]|uniref:Bug family tripartite tricarboxylate transporter substrate binding protein n=1 Tax=unclassified Pseudacidovorax TaxID=2620592 RepID=UPI001B67EE8E|nr:tripartite tricarboxylate transporter substrate binding protein [Pseudacidovorax sp.]MBP6894983.1 tripartite tricarboxylate transporter substrate binding protein [Pseudacidovorax sp.]
MHSKRQFLAHSAALAAGSLLPGLAGAQGTFPSRPIRIVVPNAAGGGADLTARAVGQAIAGPLGQAVVIDNKPSAGGIVAGETVSRAEPDGHTLLLISSGSAVSAALFKTMPFDTLKDFAPISLLATFDLVIAVAGNSRFKSLPEMVSWAKANPGKLNIGTPQIGTTQNLAAEMFKLTAGIDAQVVPFNGTPPVVTAVRGGEIDAMVDILGPLVTQISGKTLRALAVLGKDRAPQLPDVPAARETGPAFAQMNLSSWNGLAAPAKTPPAVVDRLSKEIQAALAKPELVQRLRDLNLTARSSTPQQARDFLAADIQRWSDVIAKAKIQKL